MIYSISDGKKFSFGEVYIGCMMNCFSNNFLTSMNVEDQGGYIVFDTHCQVWFTPGVKVYKMNLEMCRLVE